MKDQIRSDADWLNIAVRHIGGVRLAARSKIRGPLATGIGAEQLDGVPTVDLLNMIEPSVASMLADGYNRVPHRNESESVKQSFAMLQVSLTTLADLLELMGDQGNAAAYRALTNPEKLRYLMDRQAP